MTTEQTSSEAAVANGKSCTCTRSEAAVAKPGHFLCPTAEYLWARVGVAHKMHDYAEADAWRARYEEHMNTMEATNSHDIREC